MTVLQIARMAIPLAKLEVSAYTIPTDAPESDGTLEWNSTTLIVVEAEAGDQCGLGYTYADTATASLIRDKLADVVEGCDAMAVQAAWHAMVRCDSEPRAAWHSLNGHSRRRFRTMGLESQVSRSAFGYSARPVRSGRSRLR